LPSFTGTPASCSELAEAEAVVVRELAEAHRAVAPVRVAGILRRRAEQEPNEEVQQATMSGGDQTSGTGEQPGAEDSVGQGRALALPWLRRGWPPQVERTAMDSKLKVSMATAATIENYER
jgi:hypothetical protein